MLLVMRSIKLKNQLITAGKATFIAGLMQFPFLLYIATRFAGNASFA